MKINQCGKIPPLWIFPLNQTIRVMKLTAILLTITCLHLSAKVFSQRISLNEKNAAFSAIVKSIEKQSGYKFFYDNKLVNPHVKITVSLKNVPLEQALEHLLEGKSLSYNIVDQIIVLKQADWNTSVVTAFDRVTGKVVDERNLPMPGVSIKIKNNTGKAVTDADGKFQLVAKKGDILVFSFIGYISKDVVYDGQAIINVSLIVANIEMNEIVVVGYGERKKRDLTGALSSLQAKDIVRSNPVLAAKAIQGTVAGATVTKASNRPGAPYNITIRGENTINNSTQPLVVIDGLMGGDLNTLNPNDIQSMDILKDASSTAIYGARGANGVVIVTTKKGLAGETKLSYDAYVGTKKMAHMPEMMSTAQFYKLAYTDMVAAGLTGTVFTIAETANIDAGRTTNWADLITHNGVQTSHNLSLSGGSDKTTYRFSGGYLNEQGNVKYTGYKRYNLNAGLDGKLGEHVKVGFTSYVTYSDQNWGSQESLRGAFRARPTGTPYYSDLTNPTQNADINVNGLAIWMGINDKQVPNPLSDIDPKTSQLKTTTLTAMGNTYAEVSILKGLSFRSSLSASYSNAKVGDWRGTWSKSQIGSLPRAQLDTRGMANYTFDNILNYKKDIGKHSFGFTGLYSAYYQRDETTSMAVKDLPYTSYWYALNTGTITARSSNLIERSLLSYMGRINYTYDDKYLLTLTGRSDGASQLADGNKWAFFPSVAFGWRMSEERFIEKLNLFSNLKLRASYGEVGNATVSPYSTQALLLNTGYDFDGTAAMGFAPANLGNKSLRWERSKELNLGLDLGVLKNRITAAIEVYKRKTVDLILNQKVPTVSGFGEVIANVGEIENKGVEITLNTVNIMKTDFGWNSTFSFTKNNNKLLELYGGTQTFDKGNKLFVGYPIRANFDYQFAGIWQLGDVDAAKVYGQLPGSVRVVDQNNDNKISSSNDIDDRRVLGTQLPNWLLGVTNRFNYKNFDLSFFMYYRNGGQFSNATLSGTFGELGTRYNSLASLDYWTKDNPSNTYFSPYVANPYRSAINYQDASFLRISDITVGYTLPKSFLSKYKMANARFYAQVSNPFIFSSYTGFDPEFNSAIYQDDVPSAIYSLGVNISF